MDDDITQVRQRFQRRPLSDPGRLAEAARRRGLDNASYDRGRRPDSLENRAMLRSHFAALNRNARD
jgi:hypothetical protein